MQGKQNLYALEVSLRAGERLLDQRRDSHSLCDAGDPCFESLRLHQIPYFPVNLGEDFAARALAEVEKQLAVLPTRDVAWTPRIGINVGIESEWRCIAVGSPALSGLRRYLR